MKIIISPAKKMKIDTDTYEVKEIPVFLEQTKEILAWMRSLSWETSQKLWKCNDKLTDLNYARFQEMDLLKCLTPAIISYEGLQYQHMNPGVMEQKQLDYIQENLRILSGFYGMLKPFDGVVPYRLEMQAKAVIAGCKNLYEYWGDRLYRELTKEDTILLNLASKEYSKVIAPYLTPKDTFVTCVFGEIRAGKVIQKGTMAKMARGEMVHFLAAIQAESLEEVKGFHELGYEFREELSNAEEYVFISSKKTTTFASEA
jgi:cytoplasmic iron level regulating protein YaaA (DUF328/UPF0246 family)